MDHRKAMAAVAAALHQRGVAGDLPRSPHGDSGQNCRMAGNACAAHASDPAEGDHSFSVPQHRKHQWLWHAWVQCTDGPRLRQIASQLARLQRLHAVATGTTPTGRITDEHIQQARAMPLASLVTTPLRPSGKTLCGRCPLHDDKRPSFYVYPATNSWYCFGCHRGGDAIAFVRHLHGHSFVKAVHDLITHYA